MDSLPAQNSLWFLAKFCEHKVHYRVLAGVSEIFSNVNQTTCNVARYIHRIPARIL